MYYRDAYLLCIYIYMLMYVCVHIHIHTCVYMHICTSCTHTYMHVRFNFDSARHVRFAAKLRVCVHEHVSSTLSTICCTNKHVYACMCVHGKLYTYTYTHTQAWTYVSVYACMCVNTTLYNSIHTHTHEDVDTHVSE